MSSGHGCRGGGGGGVGGGAEEGSGLKKGPWTAAEDAILMEYVKEHGEGNWNAVQKNSGLSRCGKSCRLRWANHLRPKLKKGAFSPDEECLILQLHFKLGNKWSRMAEQLPGRTDNEIKNYWNTRIKRRRREGLPLYPPDIQRQAAMHADARPPAPSPSLHLLDHAAAPVPPPSMASQLPGRTDNEIKNYSNARIKRRRRQGLPLYPPDIQRQAAMHAAPRLPAPSPSLHVLDHDAAPVPPPPMGFYAQSFVQDAGYNGGHHQVHHFLPPGASHHFLSFPSHGQMHPFLHQGQGPLHFGGAGMANLNPPPDAGVSIILELPSSQNPDPGSSSLIYEMPDTDLDAFVLHSGDGGQAGYLLDPPMSLNASSSNAIHWTGSGGGDSNSDQVHHLHQGQGPLHFGGAGMANLNPPLDAGVSIILELPSSQNPDPGSSSLIYETPATDLDAFVLHSGDGGQAGYLLDPPMSLNASSSNAIHLTGGGGGGSNSDQVHHFPPPGAIHHFLSFPSHGQMHPFLHQGQGPLHFGGAGMANLDPPPDAGVSIILELPSSQNPDPGSSLIYEMPAIDLDAFVLHSGDGGQAGYLLDPPMSLNAPSSNAVHWTGSGGGGDSNSDHLLPRNLTQGGGGADHPLQHHAGGHHRRRRRVVQ